MPWCVWPAAGLEGTLPLKVLSSTRDVMRPCGMSVLRVDLVKNCDLMWKQSVWTSVLAAQISSKHLRE